MKPKIKRLLSLILSLVLVLGLMPATTSMASEPGETADNPVVCTTFAEFKEAMESTTVTYVKLNGVSGSNGDMPSQESLAAAISNTTYKVLTIEGTNTFTAPLNGMNDCLIWPRDNLMINGTGTLKYEHGNTGGTGAVINMASNVLLTINGNVTLEGGANGTSFGYAIFAHAGNTTINGGSFIGYNAMIADSAAMSAVIISSSANLTINGGNFSASLHPSSPEGKKAHSLSITSTSTGAISIKEGTFSQGINIDATGKTIETCGYFDTAKASITAGGSPVEATASTDVLESTEVIVTDTSVIGSVTVAVTTPVAGAAPAAPTTSTANVTVSNYMWTIQPGGTGISSFEAGKTYRCTVLLNPTSGYTFKSGTTVTIGGQTATIDSQSETEIKAHVDFTTPAIPVSSVAISVTAPTAGATQAAPTTSTANVSIIGYQWKISGGSNLDPSTAFEAGNTYRLEMTINPTTGQTLSNTATATVNGNAATVWDQSTSYLNCYYEFPIPAAVVPVSSVAISVTAPTAGATPSAPTTSTANVSIVGYQWKISGGSNLDPSTAFEAGNTYRLEMTINPTTGQTLSNTATATMNGNAATVWDQSTSYLNCYYDFPIPAAVVPVSSVAISVTAPTAGATQAAPTTSTANVSIVGYQWKLGGYPLAADATFEVGNTYRLEMTINPTSGQTLSNTATATVNGNAATAMDQSTSYLNCYYEFTVESTIDTIAATITPPVAGATPDLNLVLPTGVQICTSGSNYWSDMSDGTETGTVMAPTDTYIAGRTYRCRFTVEAKLGYVFANPISAVTLNGNATTIFFNNTDLLVFDATFVATASATEYDITVTDGKATIGAGTEIIKAAQGTTVTLTADAAPAGKVFDKWVVVSGSITLADANSATTTFTMPAGAVSVKATYKNAPVLTDITTANVTAVNPVKGNTPSNAATTDTQYTIANTVWDPADSPFAPSTVYSVLITLEAKEGYQFTADTVFKINGSTANVVTRSAEEAKISLTFPATTAADHVHHLTLVPKQEATCTEPGHKAYYTCDGCDDWFEDATGSSVISDRNSVEIPATGHSYGSDNVCDICGHIKNTETDGGNTPDNGNNNNNNGNENAPDTGDIISPFMWAALLFAGGFGIFGVNVYVKKKREENAE